MYKNIEDVANKNKYDSWYYKENYSYNANFRRYEKPVEILTNMRNWNM